MDVQLDLPPDEIRILARPDIRRYPSVAEGYALPASLRDVDEAECGWQDSQPHSKDHPCQRKGRGDHDIGCLGRGWSHVCWAVLRQENPVSAVLLDGMVSNKMPCRDGLTKATPEAMADAVSLLSWCPNTPDPS